MYEIFLDAIYKEIGYKSVSENIVLINFCYNSSCDVAQTLAFVEGDSLNVDKNTRPKEGEMKP